MTRPPVVLSIAGSDSGGGAGIQADQRTVTALGGYCATVVTAVTAQSTRGVRAVHPVPLELVAQQFAAVTDDIDVDAVKIGMLGDAALVDAVAGCLEALLHRRRVPVVLDPVMVATSGDRLLPAAAVVAVRDRLVPLVDVVTPNLPEAAALLDEAAATNPEGMRAQLPALVGLGAGVLLKGGHLHGDESLDLLQLGPGDPVVELRSPRRHTRDTHGTGCTLSSALAVLRVVTGDWEAAAQGAKAYVDRALRGGDGLGIGGGTGPVWAPH